MFLLTVSAHFGRQRPELVAMVPPSLPAPGALVTLTDLLELTGAAGLLLAPTALVAAVGLAAMLVLVFPANVRAARQGLTIGGRRATALGPRLLMQLLLLAALVDAALRTSGQGAGLTRATCLGHRAWVSGYALPRAEAEQR